MNLFLNEPDVLITENFILPKSLYLCMVRNIEEEGVARSEELQPMEHGVLINGECAREEREEAQETEVVPSLEKSNKQSQIQFGQTEALNLKRPVFPHANSELGK